MVDCAEGGKALDFSRNAPAKPERTRESIRYYNDVTGQRGCINKKILNLGDDGDVDKKRWVLS